MNDERLLTDAVLAERVIGVEAVAPGELADPLGPLELRGVPEIGVFTISRGERRDLLIKVQNLLLTHQAPIQEIKNRAVKLQQLEALAIEESYHRRTRAADAHLAGLITALLEVVKTSLRGLALSADIVNRLATQLELRYRDDSSQVIENKIIAETSTDLVVLLVRVEWSAVSCACLIPGGRTMLDRLVSKVNWVLPTLQSPRAYELLRLAMTKEEMFKANAANQAKLAAAIADIRDVTERPEESQSL
jgi:hypothetical protein